MAKTIAVSDEVYKKLKKARMPRESLPSTIKRSLEMRPKLSGIIGSRTLSRKDWVTAKRSLVKAEKKSRNWLGNDCTYSTRPLLSIFQTGTAGQAASQA